MKFNPKLQSDIQKYIDYMIIVEGKKQENFLRSLGFEFVFSIYESGVSLNERLIELKKILPKRKKVCILTDLDKRGKKLYFQLKELCKENGIKTDSTLRGILLVGNLGSISKLDEFMKKANNQIKVKERWEVR